MVMVKRIAVILAIFCCVLFGAKASAAMILEYEGGVHNYTGSIFSLSVNGKQLNNLPLEPIIFNERALVPVREVFEALGATVLYDGKTKKITVMYNGKKSVIQIGSEDAEIDGKKVKIPEGVTPKLIAKWGESAKTMVPVRFVSDSVGLIVEFDVSKGLIMVREDKPETEKPPENTSENQPVMPQNKITDISATESEGVVTIKVKASEKVAKMTEPIVTQSGVLYVDVENLGYKVSNKQQINLGAVLAVRLGLHENSVRIAVDTEEMYDYDVSASGNYITFKIAKEGAEIVPDTEEEEKPEEEEPKEEEQIPRKKPSELSGGKIYVVLDAGHGGTDPGASGRLMTEEELSVYHEALESTEPVIDTLLAGTGEKYVEKDIALLVVLKVKERLEEKGVEVILTRSDDTYPTLDERPELANGIGAAMFLSVHLNSTVMPVTAAQGMEIYYCEKNNGKEYGISSKEMASIILKKTVKSAETQSRGVKSGNLLVTRKSYMPANLIEIGFMNNPDELAKLITDEYQNQIADGIAEGILEVLGKIKLP